MSTPLINGINYSWANITLTLFGVPVVGITKIEYKRKQKKENNYGYGSQPVSRGYSNFEYEGSIELYLDEWKRIIASAPNRDPLLIAPFDIQVNYSGRGVLVTTDKLQSCEFMEDNFTANQGDSKLMVTVPIVIGAIVR
jgi:hypothetical protein